MRYLSNSRTIYEWVMYVIINPHGVHLFCWLKRKRAHVVCVLINDTWIRWRSRIRIHCHKLTIRLTVSKELDIRCKPTMSPFVARLDNITNKGWVTIANSNGLRGHPCRTDLVRAISYVTPPLSITRDSTSCPNKNMKRDIRVPKPVVYINPETKDQFNNMIISFLQI